MKNINKNPIKYLVFGLKSKSGNNNLGRKTVKTKSKELDQQILKIFQTFKEWKAGTLDGKAVDSRQLFSYKIKKGQLIIN